MFAKMFLNGSTFPGHTHLVYGEEACASAGKPYIITFFLETNL